MAETYRMSSQIKFNIRSYLERAFVNDGMYLNVSSGQADVAGNDISRLKQLSGTVFEGFTDRWVYETDASGISPNNTTICSGVYINKVFYPRGSGTFAPVIDFNNGKVILATGVGPGTMVQANFSYKHVVFEYPDSNRIRWLFSTVKNNMDYTPHAYPSGNQRQLPLVIIDMQKRTGKPFALGGHKEHKQLVVFHIYTNNDGDLEHIIDMLADCERKVIRGIDFNLVPQILTYQGDKANTYQSYTQLQGNANYWWTNIYIDEAVVMSRGDFGPLFRARVDWNVTIYR